MRSELRERLVGAYHGEVLVDRVPDVILQSEPLNLAEIRVHSQALLGRDEARHAGVHWLQILAAGVCDVAGRVRRKRSCRAWRYRGQTRANWVLSRVRTASEAPENIV